jgi:hypothetical protein
MKTKQQGDGSVTHHKFFEIDFSIAILIGACKYSFNLCVRVFCCKYKYKLNVLSLDLCVRVALCYAFQARSARVWARVSLCHD